MPTTLPRSTPTAAVQVVREALPEMARALGRKRMAGAAVAACNAILRLLNDLGRKVGLDADAVRKAFYEGDTRYTVAPGGVGGSFVTRSAGDEATRTDDDSDPTPAAASDGQLDTPPPKTSVRGTTALPIGDVRTDPKRFQPRGAAFSEESAQRVATDFDANLFEPIVVWTDPADGEPYVLAGHSRLEGFKRRFLTDDRVTSIPVRYFKGDEAAARRFAATENDKGTAMSNAERAAYLRTRRDGGRSEAALRKEADTLYKRDAATVVALSRLNPTGKAIAAVRAFRGGTDEARDAETMASWLGKLRTAHPGLTDRHEGELFDWLLNNYKSKGQKVRSYDGFATWAAPRIDRATSFGQVADTLNLTEARAASKTELAVDDRITAAERELAAADRTLRSNRERFLARGGTVEDVERATRKDREAVAIATRDLLNLRQSRAGTISAIRGQEMSLFTNPSGEPVPGLLVGQVSDVLAYLGRCVYLSTRVDPDGSGPDPVRYEYFKAEDHPNAEASHLLYDPGDGTLYLVPDARVRPVTDLPPSVDLVDARDAEAAQTRFHGFEAGSQSFAVDWPDPLTERCEAVGCATQIRYLSDKLGHHEMPDGTRAWGQQGVIKGFKHLFPTSPPVHVIGRGERAVLAVGRVLVTEHGLVN